MLIKYVGIDYWVQWATVFFAVVWMFPHRRRQGGSTWLSPGFAYTTITS